MIEVSNQSFLKAVFGQDYLFAHVTDFPYDPAEIPKNEHLRAWSGNYFSRYQFSENTNQYFTISTFDPDENGKARRRKALFKKTHCLVLDDVREKLSEEAAQKLPRPSWIMETSPGSFQWGYILNTPCTVASKIDNLNDGLIASELAPDGKDPGQRGVTRYVRLPEGFNTKKKKMINGQPFKCHMVLWEPFNTVTLEQLAEPFQVDLNAQRREGRVDGAADISDHPLVNIPEIINIKEVRSDGRFDITCPWVDEHTGADDSGSGIFTNSDGTIGFKCHHGACQSRTGSDLLRYIEDQQPGFSGQLSQWQADRQFKKVLESGAIVRKSEQIQTPDFTQPIQQATSVPSLPEVGDQARGVEAAQAAMSQLQRELPGSIEQRKMAAEFLKAVESLPTIDQVHWHQQLKDTMRWNQKEFNAVLHGLRAEWYESEHQGEDFYNDLIYVSELDKFYNRHKRIFYTPQAFQNSFAHLEAEARKRALEGKITKVDKIDYAPGLPETFTHLGAIYANSWQELDVNQGTPGDVARWLEHWDALGWSEHRDHMLQWMAWTILHPESKINHMLLLGGAEGIGKDFLLQPLKTAMEGNHETIDGDVLMSNHNEHLLGCKYLHINEIELSDHREADSVGKKIKPLAAAPPDKLRVNPKGVTAFGIRNIVNSTMGTNSTLPFKTRELSRRLYGAWSTLNIRDHRGEMLPEWREYWNDRWTWMNNGGVNHCIYYLRNCVDLSNFNPAAAPQVTEFVRHIYESSKPALNQTIENMIRTRTLSLGLEVVDVNSILSGINTCEEMYPDKVFIDAKYLTPMKVLNTMMSMRQFDMRTIDGPVGPERYWILDRTEHYMTMDDDEFRTEAHRQTKRNEQDTTIAVKNNSNVVAMNMFKDVPR